MKLKFLKKLTIICMSFSLAVTMLPASVLAAGDDTVETYTQESPEVIGRSTEEQTKAPDTEPETKKHQKETEIHSGFVPDTEIPVQTEAPVQEVTPETAGENQASVGKMVRSTGRVTVSGTPGIDYINENGKYTVKENVTMTLKDGAGVGEVTVEAGKTLTLVLKGTKENVITKIDGEGKVVVSNTSNGKASLKDSISVAELVMQGGTILGQGTVKSASLNITGGSLACNVESVTSLKRTEFQVEKNAACTISDLEMNGVLVNAEDNTVWSDGNGKVVLYLAGASTVSFNVKAMIFDISEDGSTVTAKQQSYTYEDSSIKKGKSLTAYTVKAGADLKTVYGEKLENADIITVSGSKDYLPEVTLDDYDGSMDVTLELKDPTAKGYKVTKKNVKEVPVSEPYSYELTQVTVKDTFGYEHELTGVVTLTIDKKELTPTITINKTSTTSKSKATKVYDGTTDVPEDTCELTGFSDIVEGDKAADILAAATASFVYDDANVAKAKKITATVTLKGDWGKKYTVASVDKSAEITKAPLTEELMKTLGISIVKPEIEERHYEWLTYKTVAGQEYAYSEKAKDDEWKLYSKAGTVKYINEVDGEEVALKAGTSYKIYTRIPETDNYQASDPVYTSIKTLRAPKEAKESDVKLSGVTDNSTQKLDTTLNFTATGSTYVDEKDYKPSLDDEKYVPYSWKLTDTTVWKKQASTQKFTVKPTKAGTYTIVATFRKYVYNGEEWERDEDGDVKKSVTFKANATGSSTGSGSSGSGSSSTVKSATTAARTGDTTPLAPIAGAFVLSGAALAAVWKKRKKA